MEQAMNREFKGHVAIDVGEYSAENKASNSRINPIPIHHTEEKTPRLN
jgi:hypothetical protein